MARPSVRRQIRRLDNGERRKLGEDRSSKKRWRAPLPGDGTLREALPLGQGLSQDHQAGISEPIASRSIQVMILLCDAAAAASTSNFFAQESSYYIDATATLDPVACSRDEVALQFF